MKAIAGRKKEHLSSNLEAYVVEELVRYDLMDQYTFIMYDLSDGDPDDDATVTQRRSALWRLGTCPEDAEAYKAAGTKGSYRWDPGYRTEGCLHDEAIETTKVGDYSVAEFKEQYDKVTAKPRGRYNYEKRDYDETDEESDGEKFFRAIEVVAEDPENEEAWAIIKEWRDRQIRHEIGWNG